ncbi:MAG: hypothetical protein AAGO57_07540 [Pseudomonadota bacterium]
MRRLILLFCLIGTQAQSWVFDPVPICRLSHDFGDLTVEVTYDPRLEMSYAITVTNTAPWKPAAIFGMTFFGGRENTITTPRHTFSDDMRSVTVRDRGFGNVLDGLEFNQTASAFLGDQAVNIPLAGAREPVQAFRACAGQAVA